MRATLLFCLLSISATAQFSIRGIIASAQTNFQIYDGIYVELIPSQQYTELKDGKFQFTDLKKGNYRIQINALGFNTFNQSIELKGDTLLSILLKPSIEFKDEVVILAFGDVLEIWNSEVYYSSVAKEPENFAQMADEIWAKLNNNK